MIRLKCMPLNHRTIYFGAKGKHGRFNAPQSDANLDAYFRPSNSVRRFAILLLVGAEFVAVGSSIAISFETWNDKSAVGCILCILIWQPLAALAVWEIVVHKLMFLAFNNEMLTCKYVHAQASIQFQRLRKFKWFEGRKGIVLIDDRNSVAIGLHLFEPRDRLQIIRHLYTSVPTSQQTDWGRFCHSYALGLRDRIEDDCNKASSGSVTLSRSTWTRYFLPTAALLLAASFAVPNQIRGPIFLAPIGLLLVWGLLLILTPASGLVVPRFALDPLEKQFGKHILGWGAVSTAIVVLLRVIIPAFSFELQSLLGMSLWIPFVLWRAHVIGPELLQHQQQAIARSVAVWELGEELRKPV